MSPSIATLAKAVVAYQRDQSVRIVKDTDGYNYEYLSLGGLLEVIQEELAAHKLAVVQFPTSDGTMLGVVTVLLHESGEYIESEFVMPIPGLTSANVTQMAGAAITYARRYALTAVCRVVADSDTDGT